MGAAFVLEVAGAEVAAVVAGEHHEGVVELSASVEGVEEPAEVGVDAGAAGEVLGVVPAQCLATLG